ncbi:hypothetical protein FOZ63_031440, partial [Perkinsus olseni]
MSHASKESDASVENEGCISVKVDSIKAIGDAVDRAMITLRSTLEALRSLKEVLPSASAERSPEKGLRYNISRHFRDMHRSYYDKGLTGWVLGDGRIHYTRSKNQRQSPTDTASIPSTNPARIAGNNTLTMADEAEEPEFENVAPSTESVGPSAESVTPSTEGVSPPAAGVERATGSRDLMSRGEDERATEPQQSRRQDTISKAKVSNKRLKNIQELSSSEDGAIVPVEKKKRQTEVETLQRAEYERAEVAYNSACRRHQVLAR